MNREIVQQIDVQDVTRMDCAVFHSECGIVGQSWHVDVKLIGDANAEGFLYDFSKLKKTLKNICDESFDHTLMIPTDNPSVKLTTDGDTQKVVVHSTSDQLWAYDAPKEAFSYVQGSEISKNSIETELSRLLFEKLPSSIIEAKISLREEKVSEGVFFRYTHGLYNYNGLCRRLFHGHRGLIKVYIDEIYSKEHSEFVRNEILSQNVHIAPLLQQQFPTHACLF